MCSGHFDEIMGGDCRAYSRWLGSKTQLDKVCDQSGLIEDPSRDPEGFTLPLASLEFRALWNVIPSEYLSDYHISPLQPN
jgi:hypothetical protein